MPAATGHLYWLASYPKSGSTWMRALLSNYLSEGDQPVAIDELLGGPIASSRALFDEHTGLESSDLNPHEIERLRPAVYERMSRQAQKSAPPTFVKVHDAYTWSDGNPLFPPQATAGAIYLVRDPLDVAVSLSHHIERPIAEVVELMNDVDWGLAARSRRIDEQFDQRLLTWSILLTVSFANNNKCFLYVSYTQTHGRSRTLTEFQITGEL